MKQASLKLLAPIGRALGIVLATSVIQVSAQTLQNVIVPSIAATNCAYEFDSGTLVNAEFREQEVYASSQFPTNPILITEIRFRPDSVNGHAFSTTIQSIQIDLSTTPAVPDDLSPTFADNIGTEPVTVLTGPVSISGGGRLSENSISMINPRKKLSQRGSVDNLTNFDIVLPLSTPFVYNPAQGNLLIDIKNASGSRASLLSGLGYYGDGGSRVCGALSSSNGVPDTGSDALEIGYQLVTNNPVVESNGTLIVPNIAATNDSYELDSGTLVNSEFREQEVYANSQFPTNPILITEIRFRPDSVSGKAFSTTIESIQIDLSMTAATPDDLSPTFADNIGTEPVTVLTGPVSISSIGRCSGNIPAVISPRRKNSERESVGNLTNFDIILPLSTPFLYDPAQGNLLIDIKNASGSTASLLSGEGYYDDGASRVCGELFSPTGVPDTGADALEIGYQLGTNNPVPPGTNNPAPPATNNPVVVPGNELIVPNIEATNDSYELDSATLVNSEFREQEVYANTQFPTNPILITEIRFRPDAVSGKAFATTIQSIQVDMSTTAATPDVLSPIFADNVGADPVTVLSGAVSISSTFTGAEGNVTNFDIVLPLSTPFLYNPAQGNLLIDIKNASGSTASLLSGTGSSDGGASRVCGGLTSSNGVPDTGSDALEIGYQLATNSPTPPATNNESCTPVPSGIVGWWQAESNALDSVSGNDGQMMNGAGYMRGEVGTAFSLNGINNFVLIQTSTSSNLNVGAGGGFTVEGWIKPTELATSMLIFEYENQLATYNGGDVGVQFCLNAIPNQGLIPGALSANLVDTAQNSHIFGSPANVLAAGIWQHVALTYNQASGMANLYVDGINVQQTNLGSFTPQTTFTNLLLGARTTFNTVASPSDDFGGGMDEISFYNRALSATEIEAIFEAGSAGKCR